MPFIRISKRIVAQPLLKKADIEAIYRDIIAGGLGGNTYNNGSLSSTPGSLDHRNFSPHAGIGNVNKVSYNGLFAIQLRIPAPTGTASYRATLPFAGDGVSPALRAYGVRWMVVVGNSAPSAGTAKLFYTPPGAAEVQIGAAGGQSWNIASTPYIIATEAISAPALEPQTSFRLELAISSGTAKDFVGLIWLYAEHVR